MGYIYTTIVIWTAAIRWETATPETLYEAVRDGRPIRVVDGATTLRDLCTCIEDASAYVRKTDPEGWTPLASLHREWLYEPGMPFCILDGDWYNLSLSEF